MKTKEMIICSLFAAMMCIFSVMTIPIGAVPISMGLFGVILTSCILGKRLAPVSVGIYILLGALGLPIFSGFKGGMGVILGPTGGYIWSYVFVAFFIGFFTSRLPENKAPAVAKLAAVSMGGVLICYFFGTLQFSVVSGKTFIQSLSVCVLPFAAFDAVKCVVGAAVSYAVRTTLAKTGMYIQADATLSKFVKSEK